MIMRKFLALEEFDTADDTDQSCDQTFQDGFTAGYLAGQSAAQSAAEQLTQELVQSLTDTAFTYQEARHDVITSLAAVLAAVAAQVLPHCVAQGFDQQIAQLIHQRITENSPVPMLVHVHPSQVAALRKAIMPIAATVQVTADASLTPHAAWIGQAGSELHLDMDQLLADISDILANLTDQPDRSVENG
jgi:flagellar biosynthesis/type III secretory pathway protein FliH